MFRSGLAGFIVCLLTVSTARAEDWKFDVITLKNGHVFEGLIVGEDKDAVRFQCVVRKPGRRTLVFKTMFRQAEINRISRLSGDDRKELAQRLAMLDPRGEREAARMKELKLEAVVGPNDEQGWRYSGKVFTLVSNTREDIVRRVVVRLEEVFQAYTERLGTRRQPRANQLTHVVLCNSWAEYDAMLKELGLTIVNPAYYNPQKNQVVVACELERLAEELDKLRRKHEGHLQELRLQEAKLNEHFHGKPPTGMVAQLRGIRQSIENVNAENEAAYEHAVRRLFATLYHEAFHAYLENFVYPSSESAVPRWLNEGLAQIFETALVETGELRVGHVDPKRLAAVKEAVKKKQLVPLAELLAAQPKHFNVSHLSEAQASDRYFQTSWALSYYLTFDRKVLGTKALHEYVQAVSRGGDRAQAFRDLVGQPLDRFEADFEQFILKLRADGTTPGPEK